MTLRISTVVREKRKAKGLTHEQLAELISVSSGNIGQVERGELTPSISILAMLIDILGIDANTLFFDPVGNESLSNEISLRVSRMSTDNQELILGIIEVIEQTNRKGRINENSGLR